MNQLRDQLTSAASDFHCPGAQNTYLETRGFTAKADTIRENVTAWRLSNNLKSTSVEDSFGHALRQIMKDFPGVEDVNTALQLRRWKKQQDRRAARQKAKS